jgi:uncharacterized membrane protein (DUF373 family)
MQGEHLKKYQGKLLEGIKKASDGFDIFLVLALLMAGLLLIYWAVYDIFLVFQGGLLLQEGVLSMMGVLLIFYAVSELLKEELKRIKGGTLSLKVFVSLALAAVIRKVLIISLTPEKVNEILSLSVLLLSLGAVYWAIHKVEGG